MEEIVQWLLTHSPDVRIVIHGVTLETMAGMSALGEREDLSAELLQVQVSRAQKAGRYHLMRAENPVMIAVVQRKSLSGGDTTNRY